MTENPKTYFQGEDHAVAYKQFRGEMPEDIVKKIVEFVAQKFEPSQGIAVDVGCGSGQSTLPLAPHFKEIYAFDTSSAQIEQLRHTQLPTSNIKYQRAEAETLPLPDDSVYLVSSMHAVHWFDIEKFLKEVDRVLVPNGVLALVVGTRAPRIKGHEEETTALFQKFSSDTAEFWDPRVKLADNCYGDIKLPYDECVRDRSIEIGEHVTVAYIMGRIRTLSGIAKFLRENQNEAETAIKKYEETLMKIVGSKKSASETNVTLLRRYTIILARKPA